MKQSLVSNQLLCLSRNKNKCWCLCKLSKTVYTQQSPWHIFLPVCLNNNLKIAPTQTLCCLHWVFFSKEKHNTFIFPFSKQYFMYFHHIQMQICFWIIQLIVFSTFHQRTLLIFCIINRSLHELTMFSGSLKPFRYFTFSCSALIISVSFFPSTSSS